MTRASFAVAVALLAVACGSSNQGASTTLPTSSVAEQSVCPSEQKAGIAAVFGHRRSATAARGLAARAAHVGFQGLVVERRSCDDYAVVLNGLHNLREARSFRREAASVGFRVQIECRSHPVEGGLAAVFGHRRTKRAAIRLRARAEHAGFQGLRVQQDRCHDWEVDLYGLNTPAQRHELAKEARGVGFHVVFELG